MKQASSLINRYKHCQSKFIINDNFTKEKYTYKLVARREGHTGRSQGYCFETKKNQFRSAFDPYINTLVIKKTLFTTTRSSGGNTTTSGKASSGSSGSVDGSLQGEHVAMIDDWRDVKVRKKKKPNLEIPVANKNVVALRMTSQKYSCQSHTKKEIMVTY